MSIGGIGIGLVSLHRPMADITDLLWAKSDIRSILCAVVFFIVFLVLAYLTNPSENSFRAYLTEQSFRQHLSQLDDNVDDPQQQQQQNIRYLAQSTRSNRTLPNSSPFHFANRASVSLRTPKHVFHSFGLFTIAAMVPLIKIENEPAETSNDRDGSLISDSWFVGAFGRWWRGGIIEAWYQDVVSRTKDEESWSSGILGMKTLDKQNDCDSGLPFTTPGIIPRGPPRGSPPRLRNRDRPSVKSNAPQARSSTPPPLPKSASLPLHTTRLSPSKSHHVQAQSAQTTAPPTTTQHPKVINTIATAVSATPCTLSRTPSSNLFEFSSSPLIAEILRQITASKASVQDLRTQLTEFQFTATESHDALQTEVASCRERKRQEDAARLELKSRTKTLEDSKRTAESTKKDAEKKLKAAQTARDSASARMEHLDKEIEQMQRRLGEDKTSLDHAQESISHAETEISEALERKKVEIKVAEDVITALGLRAKELEDKITAEKQRLAMVKEQAEIRKQDRAFYPHHVLQQQHNPTNTTSSLHNSLWSPLPIDHPGYNHQIPDRDDVFPPDVSTDSQRGRLGAIGNHHHNRHNLQHLQPQHDLLAVSRPAKLQLGTLSNFNVNNNHTHQRSLPIMRSKGYSIFDEDLASLASAQQHTSTFSPFDDQYPTPATGVSPMSTSLIPSGIITSLDTPSDGLSRSFQSDSDVVLDREWRTKSDSSTEGTLQSALSTPTTTLTTSPTSLHHGKSVSSSSSLYDQERDPFEVRVVQPSLSSAFERAKRNRQMDMQRVSLNSRTRSDPSSYQHLFKEDQDKEAFLPTRVSDTFASNARRWFSVSPSSSSSATSTPKPKKGLNPDAKVFSLAPSRSTISSVSSSPSIVSAGLNNNHLHHTSSISYDYDALNPSGLGTSMLQSTNSSLLRAFAPSPAEREALQRVLGGSTNASLERLPSLSDVETSMSMPSSPAHVHAVAAQKKHGAQQQQQQQNSASLRETGKVLPAWLQALPKMRKASFSPWDDEEPSLVSK